MAECKIKLATRLKKIIIEHFFVAVKFSQQLKVRFFRKNQPYLAGGITQVYN